MMNFQLEIKKKKSYWNETFKIYIIKEFVQPKMSLNSREFLIWIQRGRGEREGRVGRSADRHI
jgi:hypothetical protein